MTRQTSGPDWEDAPSIDVQAFQQALSSLPPMQRQVYILHRVEGRTLPDTADQIGLSLKETQALLVASLRGLHSLIYGHKN